MSVMKSASESLAGRAVFLDLEGFSLAEIAESTAGRYWLELYLEDPAACVQSTPDRLALSSTLYEQLWQGFLPETDTLDHDGIPEFHRASIRTDIERDARLLSDVSDWQQFGRFVRLTAALIAQERRILGHGGAEAAGMGAAFRAWLRSGV